MSTLSLRIPAISTALALVAIAIGGCGSSTSTSKSSSTATASANAAKQAKATAQYEKCQTQVGPLMHAEQNLDSHLTVGMNYHDYGMAVGDVQAAYDQTPIHQMDFACLSTAGVRLEKALNEYVKASNAWSRCFSDINCSNDQVKPTLQKHWASATGFIAQAKTQLEGLRTPSALTTLPNPSQ